jgi:hypothetical protein
MKTCLIENCNIKARFNFPDEKKLLYCKDHKKDGMINIDRRLCIFHGCHKRAHYNFINENKEKYCGEHKQDGMINIISKRCLEENCIKQPIYNLPDEKTGLYCNEHKKENMIDVKNKKCKEINCKKQPSYNLSTEKLGIYCNEHKKENMINVVEKRICLIEKCNKRSNYNYENIKPAIYCNEHRKENMIDVNKTMCLEEYCNTIPSNKKYRGYCLRCFIHKFPNEKISRTFKIKETHMTDFIKQEFKNEVMIFDKQTGGCSKRRPDCYIDKFTHIIIIECDENQHKDTNCENKRIMELFQDFCNRPIVFIRFNPDKYINEKGEKIPSSFKMHKTLDVPVIREHKEWNNRLNLLKETSIKWLTEIPEREITYEYLFYDQR